MSADRGTALDFAVAGPDDDAGIRALLRASVTPGSVRVAFTREPSYDLGEGLGGAVDHTIVARNGGQLVALGRSSTRTLHRNGAPCRVGYLSELRVHPDVRLGAKVLRDGYAYLREVLTGDDASGYFTSIASDNTRARRVLELGGRLGAPAYTHIADLETLLVAAKGADPHRDATLRAEAPVDRDELTAFLQATARDGQLTPTWDEARWAALERHGITPQHFHMIRDGRGIVATAALWDQSAFRQTVIDGYTGTLEKGRLMVNLVQHALGRPPLPAPGTALRQAAVLGASTRDGAVCPALWTLLRRTAAARGIQWLLLARDARDPALAQLMALLRPRRYASRLYEVAWDGSPRFGETWTGAPFRPEVGLL
ncbi:MAG: hypothetical protein IT355_20550 [Gemmatimonadaceae bacterium]|nr:hypothetical protein [Gemmatimonadaceae bacterium]